MRIVLIISLLFNICFGQTGIIYDVYEGSGTLSQGGQVNLASLCLATNPNAGSMSDSFNGSNLWVRFVTALTDGQCPLASGTKRSEVSIFQASAAMTTGVWFYEEMLYPSWIMPDPRPEVIWQYHDVVTNGSPPIELWVESGNYYVVGTYNPTGTLPITFKTYIGTVSPGKKEEWLLQYVRAIDVTGILRVWRNGQLAYERLGANANLYNGGLEPTGFYKMGLYKWVNGGSNPSKFAERVIYGGYLKVGDSTATYNSFYPVVPPTPPATLYPYPWKFTP